MRSEGLCRFVLVWIYDLLNLFLEEFDCSFAFETIGLVHASQLWFCDCLRYLGDFKEKDSVLIVLTA